MYLKLKKYKFSIFIPDFILTLKCDFFFLLLFLKNAITNNQIFFLVKQQIESQTQTNRVHIKVAIDPVPLVHVVLNKVIRKVANTKSL